MAPMDKAEPVLVIGPGPRRAAGTDQYAHGVVRACTTLAEAGHPVILLDNAPYLALPDNGLAIQRHIEPLTPRVVEKMASQCGAQYVYADAGGECAQRLMQMVPHLKPIGSGPDITALALDRSRLITRLSELGLPVPAHTIVKTVTAAVEAVQDMDYPLQATTAPNADLNAQPMNPRTASANALVYNQSDLAEWVEQQLDVYPEASLMVEKAVIGWQRYEVIVLRDREGHLAIAGLQAYLESTGTPTAEAGWMQPALDNDAQLTESLYQTSQTLLEGSDLCGLVTVTIAIDPATAQGMVLDLTLGTSRNIAFAAVASGQPLYEIATKIALGAPLAEAWPTAQRSENRSRTVAVRLPVSSSASTILSDGQEDLPGLSLGDVMGVGEDLGEAFGNAIKACGAETVVRLDIALNGTSTASPERYLQMRTALVSGMSVDGLCDRVSIAPWFADALKKWAIVEPIADGVLTNDAPFIQTPVLAQSQPFFYWDRLETTPEDESPREKRHIIVIAGRPNTIGQSRELDLAAAQAVAACKDLGREVTILSCDPLSAVNHLNGGNRVCLGPATLATVRSIHRRWPVEGVMLQCVPGHLLSLADELTGAGIPVLGPSTRALTLLTSPMAWHDRLTDLGIPHPRRALATDEERALKQAESIGYPLLLKPLADIEGDTVLVMNADMLRAHIQAGVTLDSSYLIEEFIEFAIEVTADAICDGVDGIIPQTVEHIELAGIHPGDSAWVIPPYSTSLRHVDTISEYLTKIAVELEVKGPLSGRFAVFNDTVYLLSVDLAFTRTAAMVNEACNLPLFSAATRAMLGDSLATIDLPIKRPRGFSVREAIFPSSHEARLTSRLGPVMQSIGEVMGRAETFGRAYYKSQEAAGDMLPITGSVLITVTDSDKPSIIEPARRYREMGFRLIATRGTAAFLTANGIPTETVRKLGMGRPDLVDAIKTHQVDLIINTPSGHQGQMDDGYIRKAAIQYGIPYVSTPAGAQAAAKGIAAQRRQHQGKRGN